MCFVSIARTGGLALGLPVIAGVIDISDITYSFDHVKSISTSQLINGT